MRIIVFGDSIAGGSWDSRGGWAARLNVELLTRSVQTKGAEMFQFMNLSIGGNNSTNILSRFVTETDARYSSRWPSVLIFAYGINDHRHRNDKVDTSLVNFKSNTKKIIELAKEYTDKILFVGSPPLAKDELRNFLGYDFNDQRIKKYDEVLRESVETGGVKYVGLRDKFEKVGVNKLISFDDLHPNDAGHQLIYEIVDKEIQEYLK